MELHLTATGCHLPYGITQCYLPPDTSEHTPLKPAIQAGTRFTYSGGIEGWVDLGDWLHTEMVYLLTDLNTNPVAHGRESNSQPVDHKSNALTTTPPLAEIKAVCVHL